MWLVWTIAACAGFGAGAALQKHGVSTRLPALSLHTITREWRRVARALITNWAWVLGIVIQAPAVACMVLAVADGDISVVQPLVNANVLVAMLAGVVVLRERMSAVEWLGALVLLAGAAMVTVSAIAAGRAPEPVPPAPVPLAWVSAVFAGIPVALSLTVRVARGRLRPEPTLAVSAGLLFGLSTVWLKVLTVRLGVLHDPTLPDMALAVVADWPVFGVVACNVVGFIQFQMAFSHGRVAVVSPLTTIASVLPPVVGGIAAFGEPSDGLKVLGVLVIAAGTALLFARPGAKP